MLPRMSGLDVCRVVREERPVPIVVLTARDTEADTVAGLDLGADGLHHQALLHARAARTRRVPCCAATSSRDAAGGGPARGSVLSGAGIELSADAREVTRDGEAVALRPKEFELLRVPHAPPGAGAVPRHHPRTRVGLRVRRRHPHRRRPHPLATREDRGTPLQPAAPADRAGGSATSSSREYRALARPDVRHGGRRGDVRAPPGPGRRDRDHRRAGPAGRHAAHGSPPGAPRRPAAAPHARARRAHPDRRMGRSPRRAATRHRAARRGVDGAQREPGVRGPRRSPARRGGRGIADPRHPASTTS